MIHDVPFLRDSKIEEEAALLLAEFARDHRLVTEPPVPIEDIVELHLKLIFEFKDLHQELGSPDIHGAIWVNERRIAIDQQLDPTRFPAKRGRYHFTLAHEIGHWRLHRRYFLKRDESRLFDGAPATPDYIGRASNKNRVEVQANQFAAFLLMPRPLVKQSWHSWRGDLEPIYLNELGERRRELLDAELAIRHRFQTGAKGESDMLMEYLSRPLADHFHVSAEAMRYRLEEIGLLGLKRPATLFG